jgi:hypothetical protein
MNHIARKSLHLSCRSLDKLAMPSLLASSCRNNARNSCSKRVLSLLLSFAPFHASESIVRRIIAQAVLA